MSGVIELGYDLAGRTTSLQRPNGLPTAYLYDFAGRLERLTQGPSAQTLEDFRYSYDPVGNLAEVAGLGETRSFQYDALYRLTAAGSAAAPESYAYDEVGNRTASHLSQSHLVDAANRLTEDDRACYRYDLNGNLESKTEKVSGSCTGAVTAYSYDAQDQLVQITFPDATTATYAYDALGRRIRRSGDGEATVYLYDGPDILLEFDGTGDFVARYGHGQRVDQPLTMAENGGGIIPQ